MNTRAIAAIMRKDLRVVAQSKSVVLPMIILPLLLLVIMPGGLTLAISATSAGSPAAAPK